MLIVGYCFGIRSERRLCEEVHLNLAYRWFCRLGLEDVVPEHSTFSKNRHGRFRDSDAFRHVFETVLERCMKEGLVAGEGFAIDASVVKADAARARGIPGVSIDDRAFGPAQASRAVREYLEASTLQSAPRPRAKASRLPIQRRNGLALQVDRPSSPTRRTTLSMSMPVSSSTWKPQVHIDPRKLILLGS